MCRTVCHALFCIGLPMLFIHLRGQRLYALYSMGDMNFAGLRFQTLNLERKFVLLSSAEKKKYSILSCVVENNTLYSKLFSVSLTPFGVLFPFTGFFVSILPQDA